MTDPFVERGVDGIVSIHGQMADANGSGAVLVSFHDVAGKGSSMAFPPEEARLIAAKIVEMANTIDAIRAGSITQQAAQAMLMCNMGKAN